MRDRFVIAGDLGTSGIKIIAVSADKRVLAAVTENYTLYVDGLKAEQDPDEYWSAFCRGVRRLWQMGLSGEDCIGLSFGTQWRGIIPLSAEGEVLRRAMIWMDKRAGEEAEELNSLMGEKLFDCLDYWPHLLWFRRHEPELYQRTAYILEPNAFLKWKAAGRMVSDITNNYTRAYHGERDAFFAKILACAGIERELFPPLCESTEQVGAVTEKAAAELLLPAGVPVFGGCCDISAFALGTGCSEPEMVHAYLGTSGWFARVEDIDPHAPYRPSLDRTYDVDIYSYGSSVGPVTDWMLRTFFAAEQERYGAGIWDYLDREMDSVPAGSGRLLAAPWFFGSRMPLAAPQSRGVFLNMNSTHTRIHMLKAVFESNCYIMRQLLEQANDHRPIRADFITVCGGGALNRHWMQAMADVLNMEIRVPEDAKNTGSIGVAACALVGLGLLDSFAADIKYAHVYHPNPENRAEYDLLYSRYKLLYGQLAETFDALNL